MKCCKKRKQKGKLDLIAFSLRKIVDFSIIAQNYFDMTLQIKSLQF